MNTPRLTLAALLVVAPLAAQSRPVDFGREILPILSRNCFACHGPDAKTRKADLELHRREAMLAAKVVLPGDAAKSEVMRRLLAKEVEALHAEPAPEPADADGNARTVFQAYFAQTGGRPLYDVGNDRAFHAPGLGAVFTMDVATPYVEVEPQAEKEEEPGAEDEWEAARREVAGGGAKRGWLTATWPERDEKPRAFALDERAIAEVVDALSGVLTEHGGRIRGLSARDHLTVLVRLHAGASLVAAQGDPMTDGGVGARRFYADVARVSQTDVLGTVHWARVPDQHLVVRIPIEVAVDYVDDRIGLATASERVVVHRY